ncbi:MAG: hypothetical protein IT292_04820 [Deltaproteobacteria bacterium]|nr:hypothetical protein [Deltaproteobacteria bacterium]
MATLAVATTVEDTTEAAMVMVTIPVVVIPRIMVVAIATGLITAPGVPVAT